MDCAIEGLHHPTSGFFSVRAGKRAEVPISGPNSPDAVAEAEGGDAGVVHLGAGHPAALENWPAFRAIARSFRQQD